MSKNLLPLSIIIVNWNTQELLEQCLTSVYKCVKIDFETIVVDNHSTDDSVVMVQTKFPKVNLILNDTNRGFAAANNQAFALARGKYILLLNSDTLIKDNAVDKLVAFFDQTPGIGAVGPRLVYSDDTPQPSAFPFPNWLDMLSEALWLYRIFPKVRYFTRRKQVFDPNAPPVEVDWVAGACLMTSSDTLQKVGPLDEGYFMYAEELDWCYRMKEAGLAVVHYPAATVTHLEQGSKGCQAYTRVNPVAFQSRIRYFLLRRGFWYTVLIRVITLFGMLLRSVVAVVFLLRDPASARARLRIYREVMELTLKPLHREGEAAYLADNT